MKDRTVSYILRERIHNGEGGDLIMSKVEGCSLNDVLIRFLGFSLQS